jgi:hypothetical protein
MYTSDTRPRPTAGNITLLKHAAAAAAPPSGVSMVSRVALHAERSGPLNPCPGAQKAPYDAFVVFGATLP